MTLRPPRHPRRLVYMGTPELAVPPLYALHEAGFEIALVVSRADKRRMRGSALAPSPVKAAALELGLPVTDQVDDVLSVDADLGVVVAFGRLIKPHVLDQLAMVNMHFSLLPRWRGAAPVERAILAGDRETGVDIMAVEEGLDTGGVYAEARVTIDDDITLGELRGLLVERGTQLLVDLLREGIDDPRAQDGEPTYAAKIDPSELELDWAMPAAQLARVVRLGEAWTTFRGRRLKVHRAHAVDRSSLAAGALDGAIVGTASGALELVVVQPEGKAPMPFAAWRNGARPRLGEVLGGATAP
ncbi:MAG: methionyl-tRNA formyltransferase [Acidimicrobiales bacterium]